MNILPPPAKTATSPGPPPAKRARLTSPNADLGDAKATSPRPAPVETASAQTSAIEVGSGGLGGGAKASHSSSFRNVSACNRCRLRKNRCDQKLPSCASCEKAGVKCVGYDPITKREIPRSYVFYLEDRVAYLEKVLQDSNITFAPAEVLDHGARPGPEPNDTTTTSEDGKSAEVNSTTHKQSPQEVAWNKKQDESEKLNKLVLNVGSIPVQGASDSRFLGSTSGISFARVVFAAVKSSVSGTNSDKSGVRPSRPPISSKSTAGGGTSMRDSFFGLHTKPTIKQAPFPNKDIGRRLVDFYFEHANPQIPILHRGEFMKMFELAYADGDSRVRTPRELYMLNIVFAIGAGIFLEDSDKERDGKQGNKKDDKKRSGPATQCQPEEYHASAIVHLESCLSSPSSVDRADGFGGGLEELQSVLLLAGFALLRPVAPGLWYIIGVAVRLAVDLGLHYEDGKDIDAGLEELGNGAMKSEDPEIGRMQRERANREKGRREWVRDFRRRLWWCTYSFDRLVSTCVGRPFGITDQVITTEFPTLLDDKYISPTGFLIPPGGDAEPSYKHVAYHYFRLRLLQSEILQVLQHQAAQHARAGGANRRNPFMHTTLPSPFMSKFDSFRSWRLDIDKRLWEWKSSAPTKNQTGVAFLSIEFVDLNYWQCVIMLYRQSLSVPPMFEGEFSTSEEVETPQVHNIELRGDEERVFLKVAEAGQRILRLYRQLHRVHLVNYTFLATHHLFMAGISFLYAIWHSPVVRSRLTMDEVDFTILAATSVLGDLIEKCPPAEACRDAFDRMSKATVQMCMSTTGFSSSAQGLNSRQQESTRKNDDYFHPNNGSQSKNSAKRPKPTFDTNFQDLLGSPTTAAAAAAVSTPRKLPRLEATVLVKDFVIPLPPARQSTTRSQGSVRTPSDHAYSPPLSHLDTSSIDPALLPSPSAQGHVFNQSIQATYNMNPYQELQFPLQNAPGMDFLQGNGWDGSGEGGPTTGSWTGDLGMGLGWEGLDGTGHDFSEGGNGGVDLFEGFFFGGTGGY